MINKNNNKNNKKKKTMAFFCTNIQKKIINNILNDVRLLKVSKYLIKNITINLIKNPEINDINILTEFFYLFPKIKKSSLVSKVFQEMYPDLIEGRLRFFNGQLNFFNKYIQEKLFLELKLIFPELKKEDYLLILNKTLNFPIFKQLLDNGSNVRSKNPK